MPEEVDWEAVSLSVIKRLLGVGRLIWPLMRAVDAYPFVRDLQLQGRPVVEIMSVTLPNGDILDPSLYVLSNKFMLRFASSVRTPCSGPFRSGYSVQYGRQIDSRLPIEVEVDYVYGSKPPVAVANAITSYAKELEKAFTGSKDCRLPKRVTSVASQGISISIANPDEFLDKGRTGLPDVDNVISAFNRGGAKARSQIYTDRNPPPRRLSVVEYDQENP